MQSRVFTIKKSEGLHARPSAAILNIAKEHGCRLFVKKEGAWVEAGIVNLLLKGVAEGETIELAAEGVGVEECMEEIQKILESC